MQKLLVVGGGGREHAMGQALRTAPDVELLFAPGNSGTAECGENLAVGENDIAGLVEVIRQRGVHLVVPGPEAPLCFGLADALHNSLGPKVLVCGPSAGAARIEASKAFARELGSSLDLPAPAFRIVSSRAELAAALLTFARTPVLKADGLCGGKGVFLPETPEECQALAEPLFAGRLGDAGRTLILEERLWGSEASLIFACHGTSYVALPAALDYKRLYDDHRGPNTGGMGALCPHPKVTSETVAEVAARIVVPTLSALRAKGTPFVGFLYLGLMLTSSGIKLLEFNCRLGDPEAQVILPRLASGEFLRLCWATAAGKLEHFRLQQTDAATAAIVVCSAEYAKPQVAASEPQAIALGHDLERADRWLIHAAMRRDDHGQLWTRGGRVLSVVAQAQTPEQARQLAYSGIAAIHFRGMHYRSDIGT